MSRRVWPSALGVAAVIAFVAGCTVGPSQRPALVVAGEAPTPSPQSTSATTPLPKLETPSGSQISWIDCTDVTHQRLGTLQVPAGLTFQCARVLSALDSPSAPGEGYPAIRSGVGLPTKIAPNMSRFAPSERRPTFSMPSQRKVRAM